MKITDLTNHEIYALRKEITLNSLFIKDYENSFGVDSNEVCNFFTGYVEYLFEIAEINFHKDLDFFEVFYLYDNYNNLINYFMLIK